MVVRTDGFAYLRIAHALGGDAFPLCEFAVALVNGLVVRTDGFAYLAVVHALGVYALALRHIAVVLLRRSFRYGVALFGGVRVSEMREHSHRLGFVLAYLYARNGNVILRRQAGALSLRPTEVSVRKYGLP